MTRDQIAAATPRHLLELLEQLATPTRADIVRRLAGLDPAAAASGEASARSQALERSGYSVVLGTAPFCGSIERNRVAEDLRRLVRSRRSELLFVGLCLLLLKRDGRAALIVPQSVLTGATQAHREIRRLLVEVHRLEAVIHLPPAMLRPYASSRAAILVFARNDGGGCDTVWFYDVTADGWSFGHKRQPLLPLGKLGPAPTEALAAHEHARNNLPDLLARWRQRNGTERARARTAQSFCVPRSEIAAPAFDLGIERYRCIEQATQEQPRPHEILAQLAGLEAEILQGLRDLTGMLK